MRRSISLAALLALGIACLVVATAAQERQQQEKQQQERQQTQDPTREAQARQMVERVISEWPEGPRTAAKETMEMYGLPSGLTNNRMVWETPPEPWHEIIIYRETIEHNFPTPHEDYLEHVITYEVPEDKFDDLANYDGSVIAERTKGTLAARCHKEWANVLALNLAQDVIEGEKSVEEARRAYADAVEQRRQGRQPEVTKSLDFEPMAVDEARDPDEPMAESQLER